MKASTIKLLLEAKNSRTPIVILKSLNSDDEQIVTIDGMSRLPDLEMELEQAFVSDKSRIIQTSLGEMFIQTFSPPPRLFIIGAVHVTQHMLPIARSVGYEPVIIDPRTAFATEERFGDANLIAKWPQDVLNETLLDSRSALVALTHDPKIDDPAIELALNNPCFYIGALGSRRTHGSRVQRLTSRGFDDSQISRIKAPIGLNIGAQGPAEIAISIMAEITANLRMGKVESS